MKLKEIKNNDVKENKKIINLHSPNALNYKHW